MEAPNPNHGGSDLSAGTSDYRMTKEEVNSIGMRTFGEVIMPTITDSMRNVMEAPNPNHGESALAAGTSDDRRSFGMTKEAVKLIVIRTFCEDIMPDIMITLRKVVKEELQIVLQKFLADKDRNNELAMATSTERSLQLKFLGEVSNTVLTGDELNGKGGAAIPLVVVDKMTGQVFATGPEASLKVEILILQANRNEDKLNWSSEDFDKRIIRGKNEGKPYFSKDMFVYLESGRGILRHVKLGHGCNWVRDCWCRLGARVVDNFSGSMVKEAWTRPFMVRDRRTEHAKKEETPSLSDKICRLRNIGKNTDQRLGSEHIYTVEDLLIRLLTDYDGLKHIVNLSEKKWDAMVKHARACPSGRRMYCYTNSHQNTSVVFNIHGEILGLYLDGEYAAAPMSSQKNKHIAGESFSSAIGHWDDVLKFHDESSLQQHLSSLVNQSDSMEAEPFVGPHNIAASEMIGVSLQGINSNKASTEVKDMECIEPQFSTDYVPIMHNLNLGHDSNAIFENSKNVDTGTEGGVSNLDDWLHGIDPLDIEYEPSFSFRFPDTDTLICQTDYSGPLYSNDHLRYSETDFSNFELAPDFLEIDSLVQNDGAKCSWYPLLSIVRWCCSLKRIVARKTRVR